MKNVTCVNKRMGAMQFDYDGATLTFPPGLFVTSEEIALSAESRLSHADFQIVHGEPPRTAAEAVEENPDLIGTPSTQDPGTKTSTRKPPKIRVPRAPRKGPKAQEPKE